MLKQHARLVSNLLLLADIAATVLSFLIAYWIRDAFSKEMDLSGLYPLSRYAWLLLVIIPVWMILLKAFDAYRSYRMSSFIDEFLALSKAIVTGGLFIGAIAFTFKVHYLSRAFILSFIVANIVLLGLERFTVRTVSWMTRKQGYNIRNVVIVGTGDVARDIARRVQNYSHWGLRIIGFVAEDNRETASVVDSYPVIGHLGSLENIVTNSAVDEVIVAVSQPKLEDLEDTFLMLEDHGINARMVANIFPHVIAKVRMDDLESVPLLTFSTLPNDTLSLMIKRLFDIVLSVILMIAALPIVLLAAVAIKLSSVGPILFRQKRAGLHGRIFTLYKFRSMYADAERRKVELERFNEMDGPVFKIKDDPRITAVGRFIRRTSIDELPQLWNVLKGDMSIVGPRPPIPEEVGKYARWQRRRLSMRPGLTCLWQISGRNKITDFDEWARLDLQYIDTWSLALDLKIFLKTIPVVLFQRGAA